MRRHGFGKYSSGAIAIAVAIALIGVLPQPAHAQFSLPSFFGFDQKPKPRAKRAKKASPKPVKPVTVLPTLRPERAPDNDSPLGPSVAAASGQAASDADSAATEEAQGVVAPLPVLRDTRNDAAGSSKAMPSAASPAAPPAGPANEHAGDDAIAPGTLDDDQPARTALVVPVPTLAPERPHDEGAEDTAEDTRTGSPPKPELSPAQKAQAERELQACLAGLKVAGLRYTLAAARSEPLGCDAPNPLNISRLPNGIELTAPALVNCDMARAIVSWTKSSVVPAARAHLGKEVKALAIGASYVCRNQSSGRKLSEHAFANAIDLMGFTFADGSAYTVGQTDKPGSGESLFFIQVRKEACRHFRTVLGPGADADHADHLHLDLRGRRGGYVLCQ